MRRGPTPNGDLFSVENSGDWDDSEEMNWIRPGRHYGFPWRMGTNDNLQQFPNYDPETDFMVNRQSRAYTNGDFYNDPAFPPLPDGLTFTEPIMNVGLDADMYRDPNDGSIRKAGDMGIKIGTFTAHGSPLGLVFDSDLAMAAPYQGDGFMCNWTDKESILLAPFGDPGEDLLHLKLTKIEAEERYEVAVHRLAQGFHHPVAAEIVGNKIYVLERDNDGSIWEVSFPEAPISVGGRAGFGFSAVSAAPNPFAQELQLGFVLEHPAAVSIRVVNAMGRTVRNLESRMLPAGPNALYWNGRDNTGAACPPGMYYCRLQSGKLGSVLEVALLR